VDLTTSQSETYTPRYYDECESQPVHFEEAMHGFNGPVQVSYTAYYWNQSGKSTGLHFQAQLLTDKENWFQALNELGIPTAFDPNDGTSSGGYYLPSDIEPLNQTRSDARRTYFDPYCSEPNCNILVNSQVTQIIFETPITDDARGSFTDLGARSGISAGATSSNLHATAVEVNLSFQSAQYILT
jgi:choline dehydrogenase